MRELLDRFFRHRVIFEHKIILETDGAQYPQMVFLYTFVRLSDKTYDLVFYIFLPADVIYHFLFNRIVKQSVYCEITANSIFFGGLENDGIRSAPVGI